MLEHVHVEVLVSPISLHKYWYQKIECIQNVKKKDKKMKKNILAKVYGRNWEHLSHMMSPQSLQWWRRRIRVKERRQYGHSLAWLSGIHCTTDFSCAEEINNTSCAEEINNTSCAEEINNTYMKILRSKHMYIFSQDME